MALIKCSECGKQYSDKASACPNCACPNEIKQKVVKEYNELTSEEKTELKNYMKKKGVIYLPVDYVLCACAFVFAVLGWFFSWVLWILVPFFFIITLCIQQNRIKQYYYDNPNCIKVSKNK